MRYLLESTVTFSNHYAESVHIINVVEVYSREESITLITAIFATRHSMLLELKTKDLAGPKTIERAMAALQLAVAAREPKIAPFVHRTGGIHS